MKLSRHDWQLVDSLFKALAEYRERGWNHSLDDVFWDGKFVSVKVGPILLTGREKCLAVHILMPLHTQVLSVRVLDVDARVVDIELEEGSYVRVYPEEEGSWWALLSSRLGSLGEVLTRLLEKNNEEKTRHELLSWAEAETSKVLAFSKEGWDRGVEAPRVRCVPEYTNPISEVTTLSPWNSRERK